MSAWWEHGYPGGHMVPVPGFPRALYPPDAHGYQPSSDGPDVIAYKRTVSRAGRWPWQTFDDTYSNSFAHGKTDDGGQVRSTGIAGVQRQQKIHPPSGYLGMETFKTLRSIIIPDPLPHAGEYAMDVTAQNLIGEAYAMFHQPAETVATVRAAALELARSFLGYTEHPAGSNMTTFGAWYGLDGQPWCAMAATYWYELGRDGGSPSFVRGSRYAYVPYIVADAQNGWNGLTITSTPVAGDLVCYDWERDGTYDHVGLFEEGTSSSWRAIEGNTSTSNNSNGGEVMRRTRDKAQAAVVFVRVAEP